MKCCARSAPRTCRRAPESRRWHVWRRCRSSVCPRAPTALVEGVLAAVQRRRALAKAITLVESTRADHQAAGPGTARRRCCRTPAGAAHRHFRRAGRRQVHLHRGAGAVPDRPRPPRRGAGGRSLVQRLRRLHPRRQDAHGAALAARGGLHPAEPFVGQPRRRRREDARGHAAVRGRRPRHHHRRDGRRRPERNRGGRHDRHASCCCSCPTPATTCRRSRRASWSWPTWWSSTRPTSIRRRRNCAAAQMRSALAMLHPASPNWQPPVLTLVGRAQGGLEAFWQTLETFRATLEASGEFAARRRHQALAWMWQMVDSGLRAVFAAIRRCATRWPPRPRRWRPAASRRQPRAKRLLDLAGGQE
jgi:hypothetical protein